MVVKVFLDGNAFLTERDRNANTFEGVLTRSTPRAANEVDITGKHKAAIAGRELDLPARVARQSAQLMSDHQVALAGIMATAAAQTMTQSQGADLHQSLKDAIHGPPPAALGAGQQVKS